MGSVRRRVDRPGSKWEVRYRDLHGRQRTKGGFATKREADRWLRNAEADLDRGEFIDPRRGRTPFRDVAEEWLGGVLDVKPKTGAGYRYTAERFLNPVFGDVQVGAITTQDISTYVASAKGVRGQPLSAASVRGAYRVLKMILDHAVVKGAIRVNPAVGVRLPRPARREMLFLTADQVESLASAVASPYDLLIRFAAYSGLRAGEILGLRWGRLNLDTGAVTVAEMVTEVKGKVVFDTPKTDKSRVFRLPAAIVEDLRAHRPENAHPQDLVFPRPTGDARTPMQHSTFYRRQFKPAVKRALPPELHELRFHDLRHTCAALLIHLGAHPKEIAERLGHSSITVTMDTYGHVFPSRDEALAAALDATLRGARP